MVYALLWCGADGEDGLTVMRVDRSIDMHSGLYKAFTVYAWLMLAVYPIGVPLLYALILYKSRNELRELRRIELEIQTDHKLARLHAAAAASEEVSAEIMQEADRVHEKAKTAYEELRTQLPTTLRRLTGGYELRVYWCVHEICKPHNVATDQTLASLICIVRRWEIFECARKILLIGLPIFFEAGSPRQMIFGLVVCFFTFGLYGVVRVCPFSMPRVLAQCQALCRVCVIMCAVRALH